jgi:hypothetical protein
VLSFSFSPINININDMSQLGQFRPEGDGRASITPQSFRGKWVVDQATTRKADVVYKKMSSYLHTVANEPTVGLYHIQEHIRRSVPKFVDMKVRPSLPHHLCVSCVMH